MSELEPNGRRECCEHAKHKDEAEWIKRSTMMEADGGNIHKTHASWDDDKQNTESFDSIMRTHMSSINTTTTTTRIIEVCQELQYSAGARFYCLHALANSN